jgi:glyoxylase-like metal-dependent hydrolase (beta-lactamase superfamily II)
MLSLTLALALLPALQEQDFSKVQMDTSKVAEGIYMLKGAGGNIGVSAGEDGVFLIDDEYAPLTEKIKAAIAEISPKPIRFLLNTHWHGDHTGGNENLGQGGVLIVAHENVRKRMSIDQFIEAFKEKVAASPKLALPVVTFTDAVTSHINGEEIHAFHVPPAHTDGDAIIQFRKANVVHMGDCFFNGLYPFIDVSSGGSIEGVIAAADRVLGMTDAATKFIPGHGPLADRAALTGFRDMLKTVRDRVKPLLAAGKTLEQVLAAKPTKDLDAVWGNGFLKPEPFVAIVYGDLARAKRAK